MNTAPANPSPSFTSAFATAADMAGAIQQKRISASELLEITFQGIDRHNPTLNAIVWEDREQARRLCRQLHRSPSAPVPAKDHAVVTRASSPASRTLVTVRSSVPFIAMKPASASRTPDTP